MKTTPLLPTASPSSPTTATLVVYLPTATVLWIDDVRIRIDGRPRYLESPPLLPRRRYRYTLRAAWWEDDHWMRAVQDVRIQAGIIQTISLQAK